MSPHWLLNTLHTSNDVIGPTEVAEESADEHPCEIAECRPDVFPIHEPTTWLNAKLAKAAPHLNWPSMVAERPARVRCPPPLGPYDTEPLNGNLRAKLLCSTVRSWQSQATLQRPRGRHPLLVETVRHISKSGALVILPVRTQVGWTKSPRISVWHSRPLWGRWGVGTSPDSVSCPRLL